MKKQKKEGIYSLPDVGKYPVCTLDIDVDDNYVYVLYSGEKISANFLDKVFNPGEAFEKNGHSDQVNIYDKKTGKYLGQLRIRVQAKSFRITGKHLYALSTLENGGYPTLYKYSKSTLSGEENKSR